MGGYSIDTSDIESWSYDDSVQMVYDVEVEDNHNYILDTGKPVCVHNSSKTYSLIQFFLEWAKRSRETKRIVISRKKATWLYATVWHDFEKIYMEMGLLGQIAVNKSLHTLRLNNFTFEFVGLDDVQRLHGLTCDVFWINEAMEASKDDFDQLEQRCAEFAVLDYNPTAEEHWIYDNVCSREDCYFDHSTMLDNPFVPENMKRKILSYEPTEKNYENGTVDIRKWKIYGLGERAKIEGLIFDGVKIVPEIPFWVKQRWRCIDFGFTNDPTAIATVGFHNNTLFIDEECYRTQMLNSDIIREVRRHPSLKCWCENAEPKTIRELQLAGIPALATRKGAGSVVDGIQFMQGLQICVTERSVNAKKEFDNYTWQQDKNGHWLNVPVDDYNHCFTADTMILTSTGEKRIKDIKVGDLVATSKGLKKVTKFFDNKIKKCLHISLIFSNFVVDIKATPNHKFKTEKGWKELRDLQKGDILYLYKHSTEKNTDYIQENGTIAEGQDVFIGMSGSIITGKSRKDATCITETKIQQITVYQTSNCSKGQNTCGNTQTNVDRTGTSWRKRVKGWTMRASTQISGMVRKLAEIGTQFTERKSPSTSSQRCSSVSAAEKSLWQNQMGIYDSAQTIASRSGAEKKELTMRQGSANGAETGLSSTNIAGRYAVVEAVLQNTVGISESNRHVYDLEVEDVHEYFANGVLVHNCIDAVRYVVYNELMGKNNKEGNGTDLSAAFGH